MLAQGGPCLLAEMGTGSVPDQNDLAGKVPLQRLERFNDWLAMNGTLKMSLVDSTGECQCPGRRARPPIRTDPSENRPFSLARPRGRQGFLKGEPKFIPKDPLCAEPRRLFLAWENLVPAKPAPTPAPVPRPAARAVGG